MSFDEIHKGGIFVDALVGNGGNLKVCLILFFHHRVYGIAAFVAVFICI